MQCQHHEKNYGCPGKHSPVTRIKKRNARDRSETEQAGNDAELSRERAEYNLATDHMHDLTTSRVEHPRISGWNQAPLSNECSTDERLAPVRCMLWFGRI
jgi:hypothetical protein